MPGDEPVEYAPPVDADGQGRLARRKGANWRLSQKKRAAAIKNDPDLAPAVEHVTVADAYRIREEAANSRPGSDRGGVDIIATMPLNGAGPSLGHWPHFPTSAERTSPA